MGAILFAWLYVEWNYNLWMAIFLHSLMNVSWHLFEMGETALGGMLPNVLRGFTILSAIVFTIIYKRKRNKELVIKKDKLIIKMVEHCIKKIGQVSAKFNNSGTFTRSPNLLIWLLDE